MKNPKQNTDGNGDSNPNRNADCNSDSDPDPNPNCDPDSDAYRHAHRNANASGMKTATRRASCGVPRRIRCSATGSLTRNRPGWATSTPVSSHG